MTMEFFTSVHYRSTTWVLLLPLFLMALDIATGLCKAYTEQDFKSKKMRTGLTKKVGEIAVIIIGELFQYSLCLPSYIMTGVSLYITFMELMSNMENLNAIGVPIPPFFKKVLKDVDNTINSDDIEELKEKIEKLK